MKYMPSWEMLPRGVIEVVIVAIVFVIGAAVMGEAIDGVVGGKGGADGDDFVAPAAMGVGGAGMVCI